MTSGATHGIVLPWETGWTGLVLGLRRGAHESEAVAPMPPIPLPPLHWTGPVPEGLRPRPPPAPVRTTASAQVRRPTAATAGERPSALEDVKRNLAVGKWQTMVAASEHCCTRALVDPNVSETDRLRSLQDALREKATNTLNKRAGSILLYLRWGRAKGYTDQELVPFREATAYEYARDLYDDEAPATRASSFLEATLLISALLGLESEDLLQSARLKGAVFGSFDRKRLTVKQDGLTVAAVTGLEKVVLDDQKDNADRVFAGFAAWCVHTRQRMGDALRVVDEPWLDPADVPPTEAAFVETVAGKTKAGNVKRRRRLPLPLVGFACGLTGEPWAAAWLALRSEEGLDASVDGTMMPAPRKGGGWARRPLTTSECSDWLRMIIREEVPSEEGAVRYSAHSCKTTLLSWAAKAGMPKAARRILGSHAKVGDRTVAEYSRDELAEPLRLVDLMLGWIAVGQFIPGANRSGRWAEGRRGPEWYPAAEPVPPSDGFGPQGLELPAREDEEAADTESETRTDGADPSDGEDGVETPSPQHVCPAFDVAIDSTDGPPPSTPKVIESDDSDDSEHVGAVEGEDRDEEEIVALAAASRRVDASGARVTTGRPARLLPVAGLYQHDPADRGKARLTLHCGALLDVSKLRCNRAIDRDGVPVYVRLNAWPEFHGGECRSCMPAEAREALSKQ